MSLRAAAAADLAAALAFLRRHEQTSMFPLSNLADGGLDGAGPHGTRLWLAADGRGVCAGVVGVTRAGMVLPQWPAGADWAALRRPLAGCRLTGVLGPAAQARPLLDALGLGAAPRQHDADEPGFALSLDRLRMPPGAGRLEDPGTAPFALLAEWRAAYLVELFGTPPAKAARTGAEDAARWQAAGSHRVLWHGDRPVAVCGFNATLPDVVQVGGVYVPPGLRGRGLARLAVALMLAEARAAGVARAVLFAASPPAARAYRALGFVPALPMAVVLFGLSRDVPPCR
jgi:GNAT superfamily N-acetyltransferase